MRAETFTVAFRNRGRYDTDRTDARPWLYGIATNLIRRHHRAERRRHEPHARADADWVSGSFADGSDARVAAELLGPRIASVPAGLSRADRDLLLLIAWADLTYEEAAEALDLPMGTVRSRLHRVRKKIRRAFGDIDPTRLREEPERTTRTSPSSAAAVRRIHRTTLRPRRGHGPGCGPSSTHRPAPVRCAGASPGGSGPWAWSRPVPPWRSP